MSSRRLMLSGRKTGLLLLKRRGKTSRSSRPKRPGLYRRKGRKRQRQRQRQRRAGMQTKRYMYGHDRQVHAWTRRSIRLISKQGRIGGLDCKFWGDWVRLLLSPSQAGRSRYSAEEDSATP